MNKKLKQARTNDLTPLNGTNKRHVQPYTDLPFSVLQGRGGVPRTERSEVRGG